MNKERNLIARLARGSTLIGDDAALLSGFPESGSVVVAVDSLVQNVHFRHDWFSSEQIATKLYEMNVSDLIVKGAMPRYALLAMSLSEQTARNAEWMNAFSDALERAMVQDGVVLAGGDTTSSAVDVFSLTLLGTTEKFISRRVVDLPQRALLVADGYIGGSELGLRSFMDAGFLELHLGFRDVLQAIREPFLSPRARRSFREWQHCALAAMDQSDSLVETLQLLSDASVAQIQVDLSKVPASPFVELLPEKQKQEILMNAAEDFVAIGIVPLECAMSFPVRKDFGIIGEVLPGRGVLYYWGSEQLAVPENTGYRHFG